MLVAEELERTNQSADYSITSYSPLSWPLERTLRLDMMSAQAGQMQRTYNTQPIVNCLLGKASYWTASKQLHTQNAEGTKQMCTA